MSENQSEFDQKSGNRTYSNYKKLNYKLVIIITLVIVIALLGWLFFKAPRKQNPKTVLDNSKIASGNSTASSSTAAIPPEKINYALYKDITKSVIFSYPSNPEILKLVATTTYDGAPVWPNIFFNGPKIEGYAAEDSCTQGRACVYFYSVTPDYPSNKTLSKIQNSSEKKILTSDPNYPASKENLYKDGGGSKPFKINGATAARYFTTFYNPQLLTDKNSNYEYSLEEDIAIKDPYIPERTVFIVYAEKLVIADRSQNNNLPNDSNVNSGADVEKLLNPQEHSYFEDLVKSFRFLPTDPNQLVKFISKKSGISFSYPQYWGKVVETTENEMGSNPPIPKLNISFESPFYSWGSPNTLNFSIDNTQTANYVYENEGAGQPPLTVYSNQPSSCKEAGINYGNGSYDAKLVDCNFYDTPSGVKAVIFKGNYVYTEANNQKVPFEHVFLQTKSEKWPVMKISLVDQNNNFSTQENLLQKIIDSLSY